MFLFTADSIAHDLEGSNDSDQSIQFPLYTTRPHHVSDMKPFDFDSAVVDPMNVVRRDYISRGV